MISLLTVAILRRIHNTPNAEQVQFAVHYALVLVCAIPIFYPTTFLSSIVLILFVIRTFERVVASGLAFAKPPL